MLPPATLHPLKGVKMKKNLRPPTFSFPARPPEGSFARAVIDFLRDAELRRLSINTLNSYRNETGSFLAWLGERGNAQAEQIDAAVIREYLAHLAGRRNPGGQYAAYRVLRSLTYFWERETDGKYLSPIRKVKPPKVNQQPLPGISRDTFEQLLRACRGATEARDRAVLFFLGDTGVRASELCDLRIGDLELGASCTVIRAGKGDKRRTVYFGSETRKELRRYLEKRKHKEKEDALFGSDAEQPLSYWGLRQIIRRLSSRAGIACPGVHDFRRFFALHMLRNGADVVSLSRLLGHASIQVTQRYLALVDSDLRAAHKRFSPLDH